jgi:Rrf2 family protein
MKLSTSEEYGLRCLLVVARRAPEPEGDPVSIRDVAEAEGLSADYAAKLLAALRKADLLVSSRGAQGGYRMARPPAQITAGEVLRALDGRLYGDDFCSAYAGKGTGCVHHASDCRLQGLWSKVSAAVDEVLDGVTVAELLATPTRPTVAQGAAHG